MSLNRLKSTWEELGRVDPLWAVLVRPERRHGKWPIDDFLATAEEHVNEVISQLKARDLRLGDRVLDFGCGVGRLSNTLAQYAGEVVGLDIAQSMIEEANRINTQPGRVQFVHYDGTRLPFPDDSFDSAVSLISLQHSPPAVQLACLVELLRVVRPGGALALQIPTKRHDAEPLDAAAMRAGVELMSVPSELGRGELVQVQARITNISASEWPAKSQIRFGNHWYRNGDLIRLDDGRADIAEPVSPGAGVEVNLDVTAPDAAGSYELEFDLVQEGVAWWAEVGNSTVRTSVKVAEHHASGDANEQFQANGTARTTNGASMEMYGMAETLVHQLFSHARATVRGAVPDALAGDDWQSRTYYVEIG